MFSRLQGGFLHGSLGLPADRAPPDSESHVHFVPCINSVAYRY